MLGSIFRTLKGLIGEFSKLERVIWAIAIILYLISVGLSVSAQFVPAIEAWGDRVGSAGRSLTTLFGFVQIGALTLIVAMPVLRSILTSNPAEEIANHVLGRTHPHLLQDLHALTSRGEVRFPARDLKIVDGDAEVLDFSRLNATCFSASANYSGGLDEKLARNQSIQSKNPSCFAFILSPDSKIVGISMVIPLNATAAKLYRSGKLSDHTVMDIHVAAPGEACDCVLLFAIGMNPEYARHAGKRHALASVRRLLRGHALHAYKVAATYGSDAVRFTLQIEKTSIARLARHFGFKRLPKKGFDGDPLFESTWKDISTRVRSIVAHHDKAPRTRSVDTA
jgi:hypothetical protein